MKQLRFIIPIALIAAVATIPTFVQAQGGPGGGMGPGHRGFGEIGMLHRLLRMGDTLDLTDAQGNQILAILDEAKPEIEALGETMKQNRDAWKESHEPGDFNEAEARAFADQQAALHADLMVLTMKTRAQALSVLTPEQLEALDTLRENMRDRRGGRQGKGRAGM